MRSIKVMVIAAVISSGIQAAELPSGVSFLQQLWAENKPIHLDQVCHAVSFDFDRIEQLFLDLADQEAEKKLVLEYIFLNGIVARIDCFVQPQETLAYLFDQGLNPLCGPNLITVFYYLKYKEVRDVLIKKVCEIAPEKVVQMYQQMQALLAVARNEESTPKQVEQEQSAMQEAVQSDDAVTSANLQVDNENDVVVDEEGCEYASDDTAIRIVITILV